jgi:1-acyl-sn-glycerol-3-phosphate acyltransferase
MTFIRNFEFFVTKLVVKFVRLLAWYWLSFEVECDECLPTGPFLLVSRHTSYLDGILLGAHFFSLRTVSPMATSGLFRFPASIVLRGAEAISIKRGQPFHKETIVKALGALRSNIVLIFPEGGVRLPKVNSDLKGGFAYLAAKSGVPIVYCHLENAHEAMRPGQYVLRKKKVTLRILKVIYSVDESYPKNATRAERQRCLQSAIQEFGF